MPRQILRDVDAQELKAGDTLYFRPVDVDRGVSTAVRFPEVHNELFGLCGIGAERALDILNFDTLLGQPMRIMWSRTDSSAKNNNAGNIFIKNLEKSIDSVALYNTFSIFGNILSCKVVCDENGSRGYGYVHFESTEEAKTAIRKLNGMLFNGRKVCISHFKSRQERLAENRTTVEDENSKQVHVSQVQKKEEGHPSIQHAQSAVKPVPAAVEVVPAAVKPVQAVVKPIPTAVKPVPAPVKPISAPVKAVPAQVKTVPAEIKPVAAVLPTAAKAVQAAASATVKKEEPPVTPTGLTAAAPSPTPSPVTDEKLTMDAMGEQSAEQSPDTQTAVPAPARKPLTIYMLESADVEQQVTMLHEYLLPLVEQIHPTQAKEITCLVIQGENNYNLLNMIAEPNLLRAKVEQMVAMLRANEAGQRVHVPAPKNKNKRRRKKKNNQPNLYINL
ncbi:hypothetical protein QTP70_013893 [Hemibagrus guttatus]|uniref:Uncharacterized protein n=1 Tax=Hemibagrus guttatus TaxID=175788 RepID=A0AAE0RE06_9TELE|nr:hypothetical protein QTP70_013893 [Hemibagrus guttatus]